MAASPIWLMLPLRFTNSPTILAMKNSSCPSCQRCWPILSTVKIDPCLIADELPCQEPALTPIHRALEALFDHLVIAAFGRSGQFAAVASEDVVRWAAAPSLLRPASIFTRLRGCTEFCKKRQRSVLGHPAFELTDKTGQCGLLTPMTI